MPSAETLGRAAARDVDPADKFMHAFFAKAAVEGLKKFPVVNASVEDNDIVYHNYYDIGIAVSTERGLMVPVLRDVDQMGFARFEAELAAMAKKAQDGAIGMDDLTGGTFTITNGGIFGSMMSTPILNPPQSAILGMHNIQQRPMVIDGEIRVRPMMYLAVTYDHRIIDGREAVQFLVTIKEQLEDPGLHVRTMDPHAASHAQFGSRTQGARRSQPARSLRRSGPRPRTRGSAPSS